MSYADDLGLLWEERAPERAVRGPKAARRLPSYPSWVHDWKPPEVFPDLSNCDRITVDCETRDPDLREKGPGQKREGCYIAGVAVKAGDFKAYYPVRHAEGPNLDPGKVFGWLRGELARPRQEKLGANILYDMGFLGEEGVEIAGRVRDVQVAEPLINEQSYDGYSLEKLSNKYLGEGKVEGEMMAWLRDAFGHDEADIKSNIWRCHSGLVAPYAIGDVDLPDRLYPKQLEVLGEQNLLDLFDMESDITPMMYAMRKRGVRVDLDKAEQLKRQFETAYTEALRKVKHISGVDVEPWAPDSIARAFDKLGLPYPRTAKNNQPSFVKKWLKNHPHELTKAIMEARNVDKFRGTFIEGYILNGNINGRVYGEFHQLKGDENGTVSGRFSSARPNLQNIPKRDKQYGNLIRSIFIPEEGEDWWKFDWSQIEYRLMVHYGVLMELGGADAAAAAYINDPKTDFHQMVADLTGLSRGDAKNLNFGLAYNMGLDALAENVGVTKEEASRLMKEYHGRAPFLKNLMKKATERANQRGYITTLLGRRRRYEFWENRKWNKETREWEGEVSREKKPGFRRAHTHGAGNGLIQGSAADVMKCAMVKSWKSGIYDVLGAPHLTVHDELDGSKPRANKAADEALAELKHIMETCVTLKIPMIAEGGTGPNWGACE